MNIEDIRQKYQCDASQTFAQWKEWVRKTKPSQAQAHIVKAVAPNGSKYERLIGGYTDAQNVAFDLASHGYKDVKLYHSVNAGPLKLLRNFSAPLHGAKFKDSADYVDEICQKYQADSWNRIDRESKRKIISHLKTRWRFPDHLINRFIRDFERDLEDLVKEESWEKTVRWIDGRAKKVDINPYSKSYGHSLTVPSYERKQPGVDKLRKPQTNNPKKYRKDSADAVDSIREKYAKDAAFGVKVKGNEKGSERLTMEKVFKELSPAPAWKKVKKGNTIVIRTNINGKDQDVVTIKYFNPNIVAMTPKGGAANMVALKDVSVMCNKLGVEGRRSYNDSADGVEQIRAKYCMDAAGAGVVNPNFKFQTNVEKRLATTRRGRAMTLPQYGKPSKVIVKKDGNSFSVISKDGQKLNKNTFKSYEEAEKWARGNGWMVERR